MISCNLTNVDFASPPHLLCSPDSTSLSCTIPISCVSFSRRTDSNHSHPACTDHRHRPGTSENTFLEFPLVIAAVARFSRKRGLWLVVRVNHKSCRTRTLTARARQLIKFSLFRIFLLFFLLSFFLKLLLLQSLRKIHPDLRSFSCLALQGKLRTVLCHDMFDDRKARVPYRRSPSSGSYQHGRNAQKSAPDAPARSRSRYPLQRKVCPFSVPVVTVTDPSFLL